MVVLLYQKWKKLNREIQRWYVPLNSPRFDTYIKEKQLKHKEPDEDVNAEMERIKSTPLKSLLQTEALCLYSLRKRYWSLPAVDDVCVGIPLNGELVLWLSDLS